MWKDEAPFLHALRVAEYFPFNKPYIYIKSDCSFYSDFGLVKFCPFIELNGAFGWGW